VRSARLGARLAAVERRREARREACARCGGNPVAVAGEDGRHETVCPHCKRSVVLVRRYLRVRIADV